MNTTTGTGMGTTTGAGVGTGRRGGGGPIRAAENALTGGGAGTGTGVGTGMGPGATTGATGGGYGTTGATGGGFGNTGATGGGIGSTGGLGGGLGNTAGTTGAGVTGQAGVRPPVGQRLAGEAEKLVGHAVGNPQMVANGQAKKTGMQSAATSGGIGTSNAATGAANRTY